MRQKGPCHFVSYLNAGRRLARGRTKGRPDGGTMSRKVVCYFAVYFQAGAEPGVGRKDGGTAGRCARRGAFFFR